MHDAVAASALTTLTVEVIGGLPQRSSLRTPACTERSVVRSDESINGLLEHEKTRDRVDKRLFYNTKDATHDSIGNSRSTTSKSKNTITESRNNASTQRSNFGSTVTVVPAEID